MAFSKIQLVSIINAVKYTMMAKPIKDLELHYPMIQFFNKSWYPL